MPTVETPSAEKLVAAIEARAYPYPWSASIFGDCLRAGYAGYVFTDSAGIVFGYGLVSVAVGEAHLLNLCIEPELQGGGYGQRMLTFLLERSTELGAARMYLEVRPSNYAAQHLYHRNGFNEIGLRKNYYRADEGREDAIVFAKELGEEVTD